MATFQFTTELDTDGPEITPSSPLENDLDVARDATVSLSIIDGTGVDLSSVVIYVNGTLVYSASSEQSGATVTVTANGGNGYDFVIDMPEPFDDGTGQTVTVTAADTLAQSSSLAYSFWTGISPRLVSVSNPLSGVLTPRFNEYMLQDSVFTRVQNFVVEPIGDHASITVLEVRADLAQPDSATLIFEGGEYGGVYKLTVSGVTDLAGNIIDPDYDEAIFVLLLPADVTAPLVHLFDTIWGPMGMTQKTVQNRTVDQLVINRSIAMAVDKQLDIRLKQLGVAVPTRSGKEGANRT